MDMGSSPLSVWWRMKESWVGVQLCGARGGGGGTGPGSREVECDEDLDVDVVERGVLVLVVVVARGMLCLWC